MKNLNFEKRVKYLKENGKVGGVFDVWVELMEMFDGCGDMDIIGMNNKDGEGKWRICRENFGIGRINWGKCKKILNKNGIKFIEGDNGYGKLNGRVIDFEYKVGVI